MSTITKETLLPISLVLTMLVTAYKAGTYTKQADILVTTVQAIEASKIIPRVDAIENDRKEKVALMYLEMAKNEDFRSQASQRLVRIETAVNMILKEGRN